MATIKEVTQNAMAFAQDALGEERTRGIQLEEVEGDPQAWHITLSIPIPLHSGDGLGAVFGPKREYKMFTVLKDSGEVTSMKIRELSNA